MKEREVKPPSDAITHWPERERTEFRNLKCSGHYQGQRYVQDGDGKCRPWIQW